MINQTEALVAIDVNSGRSTRERSVEETALRTNMEAADEVARQLRLRDLAGLIVIDFIDMDVRRHNAMVERRLKDALRNDRARIQVGTISHFGLMEMSRQRLRPSLAESSFVACPHCAGSGFMRGTESSALHVLRAIEEEAGRRKAGEIVVHVAAAVALYVLNNKRTWLQEIEARHHLAVHLAVDDALVPPALRIEKTRPYVGPQAPVAEVAAAAPVTRIPIEAMPPAPDDEDEVFEEETVADRDGSPPPREAVPAGGEDGERRGKRRRRRRRGGRREDGSPMPENGTPAETEAGAGDDMGHSRTEPGDEFDEDERPGAAPSAVPVAERAMDAEADRAPEQAGRGRRRRGGRNRRGGEGGQTVTVAGPDEAGIVDPLEAPRPPAPRPYNGPTPADPFAGSFDIFEMMEREADETPPLAREPSASAASLATPEPEPIAEVEAEPVLVTALPAAEPVEAAMEVAAARDQEAAPDPAPEPVAAEPAVDAVAGTSKRPRAPRVRKTAVRDAAAVEAEAATPGAVPAEAPPAKPARVRSARPKRKAAETAPDAAVEPVTEAEQAAVATAPEPEQEQEQEQEQDAVQPPLPGMTPETASTGVEAPEVEVPGTEVAAKPTGGPDPSIVQPVVIGGDAPATARRTGWWKR